MANIDTTLLPGWVGSKDVTSLLGAGSNTITSVTATKMGVITVLDFLMSDTSHCYLKVDANGHLIVGGEDNTVGTGTEVTWQS